MLTEKEKQIVNDILSDEDLKQNLYKMLSCIGSLTGGEKNEPEKEK